MKLAAYASIMPVAIFITLSHKTVVAALTLLFAPSWALLGQVFSSRAFLASGLTYFALCSVMYANRGKKLHNIWEQ